MANKKTSSSSKKSSRKTARALPPAVRTIRYDLVNSVLAGTETSHFVDLAKDLSILNRKLFRQGRAYHVKKITVVSSNTPNLGNRISVSTIPLNWVSQMAHKRALKTWNEMNKVATSQIAGDVQGTWADFKVFMSLAHRTGGNESSIDNGGVAYTQGEWDYSNLVTPDGTTGADDFNLHMLGNHLGVVGAWNSVGLIKSYGESRATVHSQDPNVPTTASDDPLVNVFDYGTAVDEVIDILEYSNDSPPYSIVEYPGADLNGPRPAVAQDTTIVDGRATMGGFVSMLGLLEFEISSTVPSDIYSVLVELSSGSYRGIKAESI